MVGGTYGDNIPPRGPLIPELVQGLELQPLINPSVDNQIAKQGSREQGGGEKKGAERIEEGDGPQAHHVKGSCRSSMGVVDENDIG